MWISPPFILKPWESISFSNFSCHAFEASLKLCKDLRKLHTVYSSSGVMNPSGCFIWFFLLNQIEEGSFDINVINNQIMCHSQCNKKKPLIIEQIFKVINILLLFELLVTNLALHLSDESSIFSFFLESHLQLSFTRKILL